MHVAVAAGARACVAEDLEGGGSASPAFGDVRAAGLLANGVQRCAVNQLLDVEVARVGRRRANLHPLGTAWTLGDGKRALDRQPLAPSVAGSASRASSSSRPNTSAKACAAARRTSSTVAGRPSSRAIVVNIASSSPQAVIHCVNGATSRSTF